MNRFTTQLDKLSTVPSNADARFWYRMAIMDVRVALGTDASSEEWPLMKELHDALEKRYREALS